MGFVNFCIKARWWLLIIGFFTIGFAGLGILLLIFSIIGFAEKKRYNIKSKYKESQERKKKSY